jgi:DnaJ family protein A protein 2
MEQMFGMHMGGEEFGFGGAGFPGAGRPGKRRVPRKGPDEDQPYEVTLEELYKGKTTKFSSTKKIVCSHCKGTGGKEKAKKATCSSCRGAGKSHLLTTVNLSGIL